MKAIMIDRTKKFALNCWILCQKLSYSREYNAYVRQLLRSSSSVGANYRAAQRAKSNADFINKLKLVEEEADESQYFLELLEEITKYDPPPENIKNLISEADEIVSIIVASIKTARKKK
jgi:four helix bundle protein